MRAHMTGPDDEDPRGDEPQSSDELYELLAADPGYLEWLESLNKRGTKDADSESDQER